MECPICYIEITPEVNYTITSCKHMFCMKCFISSVLQNNLCPCCRSELYEKSKNETEDTDPVEEEYSETITQYTVSEPDYDELRYFQDRYPEEPDYDELRYYFQDRYPEEPIASMEEIAKNFEEKGYTILDLMQLVIPQRDYRHTNNDNSYDTIAQELNDSIEKADFDAKIAYYEKQIMAKEDYNADIL